MSINVYGGSGDNMSSSRSPEDSTVISRLINGLKNKLNIDGTIL